MSDRYTEYDWSKPRPQVRPEIPDDFGDDIEDMSATNWAFIGLWMTVIVGLLWAGLSVKA